jgi:hypothetical protein
MDVEVISNIRTFSDLEGEWNALADPRLAMLGHQALEPDGILCDDGAALGDGVAAKKSNQTITPKKVKAAT